LDKSAANAEVDHPRLVLFSIFKYYADIQLVCVSLVFPLGIHYLFLTQTLKLVKVAPNRRLTTVCITTADRKTKWPNPQPKKNTPVRFL
jgi:hypothetical protein